MSEELKNLEQKPNNQDTKVVDFFKKDKEINDIKETLKLLVQRQDSFEENIKAVLEAQIIAPKLFNATQTTPLYSQPPPQNSFSQIREFAEAMKSLSSYENSVLDKYRRQQAEIKTDIMQTLGNINNDDDDEDGDDGGEFSTINKIIELVKESKKQNINPIQQPPQNIPQQEVKPMKYSLEMIKKALPEKTKRDIKTGKLSLIKAKEQAHAEALKYGVEINDADIEKLYNELRG